VNLLIALTILALFISMLVAMYLDVLDACDEALLDELWDDGPPRAENREVVQTIRGTEASSDGC